MSAHSLARIACGAPDFVPQIARPHQPYVHAFGPSFQRGHKRITHATGTGVDQRSVEDCSALDRVDDRVALFDQALHPGAECIIGLLAQNRQRLLDALHVGARLLQVLLKTLTQLRRCGCGGHDRQRFNQLRLSAVQVL